MVQADMNVSHKILTKRWSRSCSTHPPHALLRYAAPRMAFLILLIVAITALLTANKGATQLPDWWHSIQAAGPAATGAVVPLYAFCTLAPVPRNVLSVATGAVFGLWWGFALAYAGAVLGAVAAFWAARWMGREAVKKLAGRRLAPLNDKLGRNELVAVIAARLAPLIPFTAFNYLAGLTEITFRAYLTGTLMGIVPGTAAYVAVGAYASAPGAWSMQAAIAGLALVLGVIVAARPCARWAQVSQS